MNYPKVADYITGWLFGYANSAKANALVLGLSGGIDSAVVANLCARTELTTVLVRMPIHQTAGEVTRADEEIARLVEKYPNVVVETVDLTETYDTIVKVIPNVQFALVNTRSRLRMTALYAIATLYGGIVVGTGNKVEDFGIGFYTKYGDGGVDISPIADLMKSEVYKLGAELGVVPSILAARPTDGLWADGRTDEDQIGATYDELEWAMNYYQFGNACNNELTDREKQVLEIYTTRNRANQHKMNPIPVCAIPDRLK